MIDVQAARTLACSRSRRSPVSRVAHIARSLGAFIRSVHVNSLDDASFSDGWADPSSPDWRLDKIGGRCDVACKCGWGIAMTEQNETLADLLLSARRDTSRRIVALPLDVVPKDIENAYHVQRLVSGKLGPIGGWKVGAPGGMRMCGPLPASGVRSSPAQLVARENPYRGIEAEVAFRMAIDLPPRTTAYTRPQIVAAIATMHPAIEVLEPRYVDPDKFDLLTNLADTQSHGEFIFGAGTLDWQGINLDEMKCEQFVDGVLTKDRVGYPFGDILDMVSWLANIGTVWAGGLKAGQFVTCGSWTGKECVSPNASVRVHFSGIGEVQLRYVD